MKKCMMFMIMVILKLESGSQKEAEVIVAAVYLGGCS